MSSAKRNIERELGYPVCVRCQTTNEMDFEDKSDTICVGCYEISEEQHEELQRQMHEEMCQEQESLDMDAYENGH